VEFPELADLDVVLLEALTSGLSALSEGDSRALIKKAAKDFE
jgi:hypothetical protein